VSEWYPMAPEEDIDEAVERLETESFDWVRQGDY
jgi:hypothetical protein